VSENQVTREGERGTRPGRDAVPHGPRPGGPADPTGQARHVAGTGSRREGRRRRRGGEEVVPPAEFRSYYDLPILQPPVWEARTIASYFFLGGLAGASSVLAAGAELTGRHRLARASKLGALGAIGLSAAALVDDLGVPSRFPNMLRTVKPTSPMSIGSWILTGYGPAAGVAALTSLTGRFPRIGAAATTLAALTGPAVASYTAVLAADTAVPAWHDAYRQLPFVFTGSAAAAAGGLGLLTGPRDEQGPARRAALVGGLAELAASRWMERGMGPSARAYRSGRPLVLQALARGLTAGGLAGAAASGLPALARRRSGRLVSALSGAALLAGSACTRFAVFEAGRASTLDPRYVVEPQRLRMAERDGHSS
jgi:formate-dependent nitrite reductase membrane component NrfD